MSKDVDPNKKNQLEARNSLSRLRYLARAGEAEVRRPTDCRQYLPDAGL